MHTPDPIRVVRIALRLSLAAAFLSAVADRFGWWEPFGQGSWGAWCLRRLCPPACSVCFWMVIDRHCVGCYRHRSDPGCLAPDPAGGQNSFGAATCLVLIVFGAAMVVSLGMESPLSYSIKDSATAMGVSVANAKVLQHRALQLAAQANGNDDR